MFPNLFKKDTILDKYYKTHNTSITYNKFINKEISMDVSPDNNLTEQIKLDNNIKENQQNNFIDYNKAPKNKNANLNENKINYKNSNDESTCFTSISNDESNYELCKSYQVKNMKNEICNLIEELNAVKVLNHTIKNELETKNLENENSKQIIQ